MFQSESSAYEKALSLIYFILDETARKVVSLKELVTVPVEGSLVCVSKSLLDKLALACSY